MKVFMTIAVLIVVLGACAKQPATDEIVTLKPVVAGEKNDLYEVVAPNKLRLAPGVRFQTVAGPGGNGQGMVLRRPNGEAGGYVACECDAVSSGSCPISSDNPDNNPTCGVCFDSEGRQRGCTMQTIIGPPRDPSRIRFRAVTRS
jgi:hypothetical protein